MAGEADSLFDVKNAFYLGNQQQCVAAAQRAKVPAGGEPAAAQRDCLLHRAYIALGKYAVPLGEIKDTSLDSHLGAVRMYAEYMAGKNKSKIVESLATASSECGTFFLMAAYIHMHEQDYVSALRCLHQIADFNELESMAVSIQCLLHLNRADMAGKELKKMHEFDEDATLTQLAQAWVNMAMGKDKLQEAFYIYQELMDKYGQTPMLLVGQSAVLSLQHKFEQAEQLLQDALERDSHCAEALINLCVVGAHLHRPDEHRRRHMAQLKADHAHNAWVRRLEEAERRFDRLCLESSA